MREIGPPAPPPDKKCWRLYSDISRDKEETDEDIMIDLLQAIQYKTL